MSENFGKVASGNGWVLSELHQLPPYEHGSCKTCGCPADQMVMIFRGTGWCSENCRKEQLKEETGNE